ncbi:hypothetical protein SAMN05216188_104159 [Lentzea xinjiangensis]|uniref:Uncharacterized protein n=1 Tax=Lentzea xinjiangensis TaxID=402600 RepID=A0A1H9HQZ3_9PSEU|nr:hypothetical protein [Lentzea xinjiangensis]SEQ64770.1 hypothetical protein SAMN05216188_104159 [Lentzea xinjiangensis]
MSVRTFAAVVGLAFLLGGAAILLVALAVEAPSGTLVPCGNGLGIGVDEPAVAAVSPAYVDICADLRHRRLLWGLPVSGVGVVLLVASLIGARKATRR